MKNFLKEHYDHFYIMTADGQTVETTRVECFAPGEAPTADNPFKQRWLFDIEAGYIVRLPWNEYGERLHRANASAVKREERHYARKYACMSKGTGCCDEDCGNCQRDSVARTVSWDEPVCDGEDDDGECFGDRIGCDPFKDAEEAEEQAEQNARLQAAVGKLSPKQKRLFKLHFIDNLSSEKIAPILGVSPQAVRQQIATLKKKLKTLF